MNIIDPRYFEMLRGIPPMDFRVRDEPGPGGLPGVPVPQQVPGVPVPAQPQGKPKIDPAEAAALEKLRRSPPSIYRRGQTGEPEPAPAQPGNLPPLELPPQMGGLLANPLAPMFAGQYPTLEKYKGVAPPTSTGADGRTYSAPDRGKFDLENYNLGRQLDDLSPQGLMRNLNARSDELIGRMAMAGVQATPQDQARFQGVAAANAEGLKALQGNAQAMAQMLGQQVAGIGQASTRDMALAQLKQKQGYDDATIAMKKLEEENKLKIADSQQQAAREGALERYLAANPKATKDEINAFLTQNVAANKLIKQQRGQIGGGGQGGSPGVPVGKNAGVPANESPEQALERAQKDRQQAELAKPKDELLQGVLGLIGGDKYSTDALLGLLEQDDRLLANEPARQSIVSTFRNRFGGDRTQEERLAMALARAHSEGAANRRQPATYGKGKKPITVTLKDGIPGVTEKFDIGRDGQSLWNLPGQIGSGTEPHLFSGLVDMLGRPWNRYRDTLPTLTPSTREARLKRANLIGTLLDALNEGGGR